jgi:asparaginyl-tRNA synthetase
MGKIKLSHPKKTLVVDYNTHFANLVSVNQSLNQGGSEHYQKMGLTYVDVPEIVGITGACENVDTLFKVGNRLSLPLFITQTGQLSLEQSLQSFCGVWTVIHSGRDEEEEDERHLRQFRLTEEEFDCRMVGMNRQNYDEEKMFEALLSHIQKTIQAMIKMVLKKNANILEKVYSRKVEVLEKTATQDFLRIKYEEAIKLLQKNSYPNLSFGDDLKAEHEAKIVSLLNKKDEELPVFITHYSKEIKFFNMKVYTKDSRVVLSADLIFPYAGEGTGSAVREHDFEKLNQRLLTSTMFKLHTARGGRYEDFLWYLNIIKDKKTYPHAGYGIGNERVLQYIFGLNDIRQVSIFSLLNLQTGDWDKKRFSEIRFINYS